MTATSGPGLSLMSEMINLSVMAEIPTVIVNVQRGGPSTGLPTKVEQGDLNIALYGGAGDSPRVVMAPSNSEECYSGIQLAFDIAEKYQTPVIFLSDLFLDSAQKPLRSRKILTGTDAQERSRHRNSWKISSAIKLRMMAFLPRSFQENREPSTLLPAWNIQSQEIQITKPMFTA
jgi:pyruvate/2-oxoacid:ferredoxin oxidoreductase alpha subunit